VPHFLSSVSRSPSRQGVSLFGMVDATCLFSVGHHQVCGEPAVDQVGIAPPGGGRLYEVPACEHHLQLMVETYIGAARIAVSVGSGIDEPGQAPGKEPPDRT
jgi:hypothetical protein